MSIDIIKDSKDNPHCSFIAYDVLKSNLRAVTFRTVIKEDR
jgi:hypothetical protein